MDAATIVFVACIVVAGGLLLVSVLLDDILGAVIDVDFGGVSFFPVVYGFVAMFGVGGLIAKASFGLSDGLASVVGAVAGLGGALLVWVAYRSLVSQEAPQPPSLADLVGQTAAVDVDIPAGRTGTVFVTFAGAPQQISATADRDLARGSIVTIAAVAGTTLVVTPIQE